MSEPYASQERIQLPVPHSLAPDLADELYLPAQDRNVRLLQLGTTDIGHYRLTALETRATPGGYPQLVATYQRILL